MLSPHHLSALNQVRHLEELQSSQHECHGRNLPGVLACTHNHEHDHRNLESNNHTHSNISNQQERQPATNEKNKWENIDCDDESNVPQLKQLTNKVIAATPEEAEALRAKRSAVFEIVPSDDWLLSMSLEEFQNLWPLIDNVYRRDYRYGAGDSNITKKDKARGCYEMWRAPCRLEHGYTSEKVEKGSSETDTPAATIPPKQIRSKTSNVKGYCKAELRILFLQSTDGKKTVEITLPPSWRKKCGGQPFIHTHSLEYSDSRKICSTFSNYLAFQGLMGYSTLDIKMAMCKLPGLVALGAEVQKWETVCNHSKRGRKVEEKLPFSGHSLEEGVKQDLDAAVELLRKDGYSAISNSQSTYRPSEVWAFYHDGLDTLHKSIWLETDDSD
ncbi:hypothetical protein HDU76_009075, partial [Blyttiomyces sp. JEL0837]